MKGKSILGKYLRFFAAGLAVLLLVETGALIYVNNSVLKEKSNGFKVSKVSNAQVSKPADLKVNLDTSAKDVKVSCDGNYLAYKASDSLVVQSLLNGKTYDIPMDKQQKLAFYKWIYDRDMLVIAEKTTDSPYKARVYTLEAVNLASSTTPSEIMDTVSSSNGKAIDKPISLTYYRSEITDIDVSTATVTTYLKISNSGGDSSLLWKYSMPSVNSSYKTVTKQLGKMQALKNNDAVLYEDKYNGRIYLTGEGALRVDDKTKFRIIGFDSADNVYLADGDEGKTSTIYYGSLTQPDEKGNAQLSTDTSDWKSIALPSPADISDIYVSLSGNVYLNDSDSSQFTNLLTQATTSYTGKLLDSCVYTKGFITVNDSGEIEQNTFKD